jgi:hypothetical protein
VLLQRGVVVHLWVLDRDGNFLCTWDGSPNVLVASRKFAKLCKEALIDLVLWLTLLPDSDEKVGKHSSTSLPCSFKQFKAGVTKSQVTASHEDCEGIYSICGFIHIPLL